MWANIVIAIKIDNGQSQRNRTWMCMIRCMFTISYAIKMASLGTKKKQQQETTLQKGHTWMHRHMLVFAFRFLFFCQLSSSATKQLQYLIAYSKHNCKIEKSLKRRNIYLVGKTSSQNIDEDFSLTKKNHHHWLLSQQKKNITI